MLLNDSHYAPLVLRAMESWRHQPTGRRWYILVHVYEGSHRVRIDSQWYEVPTGGVYLVEPHEVVEVRHGAGTREVVIHFTVRSCRLKTDHKRRQSRVLTDDEVAQPPPELIWGIALPTLLDPSLWAHTGSQLRLISSLWWRDQFRHWQANMLLSDLLSRIVLHYTKGEPNDLDESGTDTDRPSAKPSWFKRVLTAADEDLQSLHKIADLAAVANFSVSHFRRLFREQSGESAGAFLRRRRREAAATMLLATDHRPGSVARRVGYRSVEAMDKIWQQYYGQSPGRWRRENRSLRA